MHRAPEKQTALRANKRPRRVFGPRIARMGTDGDPRQGCHEEARKADSCFLCLFAPFCSQSPPQSLRPLCSNSDALNHRDTKSRRRFGHTERGSAEMVSTHVLAQSREAKGERSGPESTEGFSRRRRSKRRSRPPAVPSLPSVPSREEWIGESSSVRTLCLGAFVVNTPEHFSVISAFHAGAALGQPQDSRAVGLSLFRVGKGVSLVDAHEDSLERVRDGFSAGCYFGEAPPDTPRYPTVTSRRRCPHAMSVFLRASPFVPIKHHHRIGISLR